MFALFNQFLKKDLLLNFWDEMLLMNRTCSQTQAGLSLLVHYREYVIEFVQIKTPSVTLTYSNTVSNIMHMTCSASSLNDNASNKYLRTIKQNPEQCAKLANSLYPHRDECRPLSSPMNLHFFSRRQTFRNPIVWSNLLSRLKPEPRIFEKVND